jgi:predicted PurR-regulated permease PerM
MTELRRRASDRKRTSYALVVCLVVVALLAYLVFRFFLATFTVAASVALLMAPLQRRLSEALPLRGRSSVASALLVLLTTLVILVPILVSATLLSQQAVGFFEWMRPRIQPAALQALYREALPARYPWLQDWLRFDEPEATRAVSMLLSQGTAAANGFVQGAVARLTSALFDLGLFLMILFFLLRDGGRLRAEVRGISPLSEAQEKEIFTHLERTVRGVLKAMVLVPFAQGFVAMAGFSVIGVPSPILWGVVVVLAAFVPLLGSPLGWVPAVVYLFAYGERWQWIALLLFGVVFISGIDNVIKPMLLKESAQIHPLPAFLSILGGLMAFGPLGFLIGPVILSLVLSAIRIYRLDVLRTEAEPTNLEAHAAAAP